LLVDAAERNFQKFIVEKISAAHDGNVFRNAESGFQHCGNRSIGNRVVVAENSVGRRRLLQELFAGFVAGRVAALFDAFDVVNQFRIAFQAQFRERPFVAFHTPDHGAQAAAADVRNSFAAHFRQMPCRERADFFVVHADKMRGELSEAAIDQNIRNARFFNAAKHFHGPLR
jgi:hypothetical protein